MAGTTGGQGRVQQVTWLARIDVVASFTEVGGDHGGYRCGQDGAGLLRSPLLGVGG